ncbi:hypothetical protein R1flu_004172 [Riccia fluitans]|uniref:Ion transport domain-containing protein n=1 Tax=Riccia fluitans TaxID=41844 RepID=A0ABD1YQ46_9MARC
MKTSFRDGTLRLKFYRARTETKRLGSLILGLVWSIERSREVLELSTPLDFDGNSWLQPKCHHQGVRKAEGLLFQTRHHDIAEPILLPAASSISVLQKASSCPDSSQLRVSPDGQSHGSNVAQMGTPENSPRDSISRIEASTSRPGSCEPARTDQEQPVEFPASSMPSLEMKTKPNPPGSGNTGRESWTFPPRLVPPSSLDHAVAYKAADLVGTAGSTSMSSLDIARERILNRMDSGATAVATNRILSKVNTGGRIRLGKREVSERFLQDLVGSAGEDGGRSTLGKQAETRGECSSKSDKLFADISESMPLEPQIMLLSPPRCVISRENERPEQEYERAGLDFFGISYHKDTQDSEFAHVQNIISVAFLADYLIRLYTETSRLYYIFSFWGAMDFLSLIPVILIFRENNPGADFIKLLHFVRLVRIFALINKSHVGRSVNQQIVLLSVGTLGVILLVAGIFHWIEQYTAPKAVRDSCPESGCISFWAAFYFLFVTVGTVGFGDITPKTVLGQFVICVAIVAALTVIPIRVRQITSLASLSPYGGSVSSRKLLGSRFLVLSGGISLLAVQNFLGEFFKHNNQQEFEAFPVRVVIMGSHRPSFDLKQVLIQYQGKAEFIEGSPLRTEDLERVNAHKAMAILIVAYQETKVISKSPSPPIAVSFMSKAIFYSHLCT